MSDVADGARLDFREARAGDLAGVMRLYRQLQPADPIVPEVRLEEVFARILATPGLRLFVLVTGEGVAVATAYLNVVPNLTRSASPYALIENVVVDESLRGKGIGQHLMAETLRVAWAEGCYKAMLLTGSKRESTHRFYRACGFSGDDKTGYVARPTSASSPTG